ncbi:MAG: hypothetical protein J0L69_15360 [Bacteroidetes bacterium]|nr:hypothetical protein [Bacteroidota bacterium]
MTSIEENKQNLVLEPTQRPSAFSFKGLLKKDYVNYEGVRRINIYVMRIYFVLMFVFVGTEAWRVIITHKGAWHPTIAVAWCTWAAYSTLALLGVFHTLRMLPVMLFMIFYKCLWLVIVAFPLLSSGTLKGSPAEEMTYTFCGIIIPLLFMPWKFVYRNYILPNRKSN